MLRCIESVTDSFSLQSNFRFRFSHLYGLSATVYSLLLKSAIWYQIISKIYVKRLLLKKLSLKIAESLLRASGSFTLRMSFLTQSFSLMTFDPATIKFKMLLFCQFICYYAKCKMQLTFSMNIVKGMHLWLYLICF